MQEIRAIRNINAGEEISLCYFTASILVYIEKYADNAQKKGFKISTFRSNRLLNVENIFYKIMAFSVPVRIVPCKVISLKLGLLNYRTFDV